MLSIATVAMGAVFTSCNKNDIEPMSEAQIQEAKYTQKFQEVFGQINPNVNWGFENQEKATFDSEGKFTGFTRGVNANGNEWGLYVNVPEPLTDDQKKVVEDWFKANKNPKGVAVNWSDFFVQQVYKGEWGGNMNYLYCGSETDHTYNFNSGDAGNYENVCYGLKENARDNNDRIYGSDKIEFMVNSSTEYFGFHNSFDSEFYKDNYVIISGDRIDPSVAGMYFVGFDFEANGQADNQKVARDYFFDNWIVKITPGFYKNACRVMVEDLIATDLKKVDKSDWDFNDAVFDVAYVDNDAVITLYAAGGTKNLTVGGVEVHEALGVKQSDMTNTIEGGKTAPVAVFRVPATSTNPMDIRVVVDGTTELKAEQGKAPQKIVTDPDTRWMKERQLITLGYSQFSGYVQSNDPKTWYKTVSEASVLYK